MEVYLIKTVSMPLHTSKVLVLNSSYEPLSICNAKNAIVMLFCQKAVTVSSHPERLVHSISDSFPLPTVVRLSTYFRTLYRNNSRLSRKNLFIRDSFQCQYCGRKDVMLTIDHVMPKSRGGENSWDNLVSACLQCNARKGNKTPEEAEMPLLCKPVRPAPVKLLQHHYDQVPDDWKPYLFIA